jgi:hypothetical protein
MEKTKETKKIDQFTTVLLALDLVIIDSEVGEFEKDDFDKFVDELAYYLKKYREPHIKLAKTKNIDLKN